MQSVTARQSKMAAINARMAGRYLALMRQNVAAALTATGYDRQHRMARVADNRLRARQYAAYAAAQIGV